MNHDGYIVYTEATSLRTASTMQLLDFICKFNSDIINSCIWFTVWECHFMTKPSFCVCMCVWVVYMMAVHSWPRRSIADHSLCKVPAMPVMLHQQSSPPGFTSDIPMLSYSTGDWVVTSPAIKEPKLLVQWNLHKTSQTLSTMLIWSRNKRGRDIQCQQWIIGSRSWAYSRDPQNVQCHFRHIWRHALGTTKR